MFPLNVVKSPSRKGEIPPMTINGTATPSHGTPRGPRDTSPSFPPKKCLVPREIPLAAVVSRSDDDDDARLHYRDLYHFRLRMRYDSAPLARSLVADRYARSRAHSLLARGKDGGMMKCRCRVRDWERRGALPSFFSSIPLIIELVDRRSVSRWVGPFPSSHSHCVFHSSCGPTTCDVRK